MLHIVLVGFMIFLCYKVTFTNFYITDWYRPMHDHSSPEKSPWGWRALIIAIILSCFFMGFFYLAIANEPDYMPSQEANKSHHMDHSASADATATPAEPTAAAMNMSDEKHAAMTQTEHDQAHASSEAHTH